MIGLFGGQQWRLPSANLQFRETQLVHEERALESAACHALHPRTPGSGSSLQVGMSPNVPEEPVALCLSECASSVETCLLVFHLRAIVWAEKKQKKQVLILSHEKATLKESMPYFSCRLLRLKANMFYGRSAKQHPPCPAKDCVYDWFKECLGENTSPAAPRVLRQTSVCGPLCSRRRMRPTRAWCR